eukprot:14881322-Alexandrium_andersonii.AAC.1
MGAGAGAQPWIPEVPVLPPTQDQDMTRAHFGLLLPVAPFLLESKPRLRSPAPHVQQQMSKHAASTSQHSAAVCNGLEQSPALPLA